MKFKLFKADGTSSEERGVPHFPAMEDGKGKDALRQVIIATHANQRQGNASTKTRSEVAGSGKKMHRQKGLGVGRVGTSAPFNAAAEECPSVRGPDPTTKRLTKRLSAWQWRERFAIRLLRRTFR